MGWLYKSSYLSSFATAQLKAFTPTNSQCLDIRSLLDPGSHFNLITSKLASSLKLNRTHTNYRIFGVGDISTFSKFSVKLSIKSKVNNFQLSIKCLVIEKIVDLLPAEYISITGWEFPKQLTLADPTFNIPQEVDLLLGAGVFWKVLKPQTVKIKNLTSKIFASQFGWLITGEIFNQDFSANPFCAYIGDNFNKIMERMWFLDEPSSQTLSLEEQKCEEHFLSTYQRDKEGVKFIVRLPFKIQFEQLGESKSQALKRFYAVERKLENNEKLKLDYHKGMVDYLDQKHMKLVPNDDGSKIKYYMPHRAVVRDDTTSTKTRIVFDASEPTTTGLSLNDCLMTGPVVQSDLFSILIRSRMYQYIFSADISQMYRQVNVHEEDTPLLKILWRFSVDEPIKTYELTTVPFGLASSPYLATRCLKILAEENPETFKDGKLALLQDCYVDNIFTGADSLEIAIQIKNEINTILDSGGFPLKKWCANNEGILTGIPLEDREKKFPCYFGDEHVIKTLGLIWFPIEDQFKVWVHLKNEAATTKREILSIVASIFDPFGILAPIIIKAKILMQSIWILKTDWDAMLPEDILRIWSNLSTNLFQLEHIAIPRHVKINSPEFIELHGFCDASEKAYGGAIYIRSVANGTVQCHLLCAKTRIAPIKKTTIARLELCGALTLVELLEAVRNSVKEKWKISLIRLWCDSQVTLCWINSHASRWQPFVANRVLKIQEKQGSAIWDYINTSDNPADFLSRGLNAEQLKKEKLWWHGPTFLTNNASPFSKNVIFEFSKIQPLEVRQARKMFVGSLSFKSSLFNLYSSYNKLIRITAFLQRFIWNLHWFGPYLNGPLEYFELKQALMTLIRLAQREHFSNEIRKLEKKENIDKNSRLISLSPFLDEHQIIRVGGRLQNSNLSFEQKYPIVLPNNHAFTKLLVKYEHERHFHSGQQSLRSILRRNFWILRQDTAIQHCIINCIKCIRVKAETTTQMMAALPKARVVPSKVFQNVGIDYAGPIKLLIRGGRGLRKIEKKAYLAVFVCFTTKAIHLELVSELTTEAFLAAFDRFVGRRGLPTDIWSDNGTNFVGASKKINELLEFFQYNNNHIMTSINQLGCSWHFIPPRSPSFGGLWEAGVKSVKSHLKRTIGDTLFTYEQYETLLIKIEACLNSRPLILESSDPNDVNALTPGHFLVGGPLTALPNTDITNIPINRLKYWELVTKKSQEFWKRWKNEYLNKLQQRNKWRLEKREIKIGDIVLVKEDNSPPLHWPLAKIIELHPGTDKITRVVTVKTKTGVYKRPVSKLIYLPTSDDGN